MNHVVKAFIGIVFFGTGGIFILMFYALFLQSLIIGPPGIMTTVQWFIMSGAVLIPVGLYFIIAAAVSLPRK